MVRSRYRGATAVAQALYPLESDKVPRRQSPHRRKLAGKRKPVPLGRFVGTLALLFVMFLILGSRQAAITQMGYEIDAAKRKLAALENERTMLEGQLAQLKTPMRIEAAALDMGMTQAEEKRIMNVEELSPVQIVADVGKEVVVPLPQPPTEESQDDVAGHRTDDRHLSGSGHRMYSWLVALGKTVRNGITN